MAYVLLEPQSHVTLTGLGQQLAGNESTGLPTEALPLAHYPCTGRLTGKPEAMCQSYLFESWRRFPGLLRHDHEFCLIDQTVENGEIDIGLTGAKTGQTLYQMAVKLGSLEAVDIRQIMILASHRRPSRRRSSPGTPEPK